MLSNLITLMLVLLLVICVYTDYKNGLIKNKILLVFGVSIAILNLINTITLNLITLDYIIIILVNIFMSFLLYMFKIWAGGDCKLFAIIILSIPAQLSLIKYQDISVITFVLLLSFLLGYIYIIIESLYLRLFLKKETFNVLKNTKADFLEYVKVYIVISFINYSVLNIYLIFFAKMIPNTLLFVVNLLILSILKDNKILNNVTVFICLILNIVLGIIDFTSIFNMRNLLVWGAILFSSLLRRFANEYNYSEINVSELCEGMILSTATSWMLFNDRLSKYKKISDETLKSRLTTEEVELIKTLSLKRQYLNKVKIVKKIPFASFICIATLCLLIGGKFL